MAFQLDEEGRIFQDAYRVLNILQSEKIITPNLKKIWRSFNEFLYCLNWKIDLHPTAQMFVKIFAQKIPLSKWKSCEDVPRARTNTSQEQRRPAVQAHSQRANSEFQMSSTRQALYCPFRLDSMCKKLISQDFEKRSIFATPRLMHPACEISKASSDNVLEAICLFSKLYLV